MNKKDKRILVASGAQIIFKAVDNATFGVMTDLVDRDIPLQVESGFVFCSGMMHSDKSEIPEETTPPFLSISSNKEPTAAELEFGENRIKSILPKLEELCPKASNSGLQGILREFENLKWTLEIKFSRQQPRNFLYRDEMSTMVNLVKAPNTWIPLYDFGWDKLFAFGETGKPLFSVDPQEKKIELDVFLDEKFQNPVIGGNPTNGLLSQKQLDLVKRMVNFAKKEALVDADHLKGYLEEDPALIDDNGFYDIEYDPVSDGDLVMQFMYHPNNPPEYVIMQEKPQVERPENFQLDVNDLDSLEGVTNIDKQNKPILGCCDEDGEESFRTEISQSNPYHSEPNPAQQTHKKRHQHLDTQLTYAGVPLFDIPKPSEKKTEQTLGARVSSKNYMVMASITAALFCLSALSMGIEEPKYASVKGPAKSPNRQQSNFRSTNAIKS
eukprot:GHVP01001402.1.p1 GENE.GHVP01001402.1~~GHVP01001402.1.p1  ORF type:complete len:447 (-),score=88.41 GHVP01001402.1:1918-3237(-)